MKMITARNIGLITGIIMIALSLLFFYILKQPPESPYQYIIYTINAAGVVWCLVRFKNRSSEDIKFKDFFLEGFKMFVIVTLLMVVFVFVFFYFNPQIRDAKFAENSRLLLAQGDHTPAEIEAQKNQMKRIFIPMMLGITTFIYLVLGTLITVITAGFLSQKKVN